MRGLKYIAAGVLALAGSVWAIGASVAESMSGRAVMADAYCVTRHDAEVLLYSVEDYGSDGYRASVLLPIVDCFDSNVSRRGDPIVARMRKLAYMAGDREFGLDIWEAELPDGGTVFICFPMFGEPV